MAVRRVPAQGNTDLLSVKTMAEETTPEMQPQWKADGLGLRGEQPFDSRDRTFRPSPPPMNFVIQGTGGGSIPASGGGGGTIDVTVGDASGYEPGAGVGEVDNVTNIMFDQDNFEIYDGGGGTCVVKLKTCPATCP